MRVFGIAILLLAFLPGPTAADDIGKARVITSFSDAVRCISPVRILNIDGHEVAVTSLGFTLEPGKHTLSGTALLGSTRCPVVGSATMRYPFEPLEALFEPGKIYYVGYDHSSPNRGDWKFVIWKIENDEG